MAHTPKPWKVERAMVGHSGTVAVKEPGSFDWICSMQVSNQPNWQDDAQLISAAPDLLDALKLAEWAEFTDSDHGTITFCPSCRNEKKYGHYEGCQIAAAISKARGK